MDIEELTRLRDEGNAMFEALGTEESFDERQMIYRWGQSVRANLDDQQAQVFFGRGIAANPTLDRTMAQNELWDRLTQLNKILA